MKDTNLTPKMQPNAIVCVVFALTLVAGLTLSITPARAGNNYLKNIVWTFDNQTQNFILKFDYDNRNLNMPIGYPYAYIIAGFVNREAPATVNCKTIDSYQTQNSGSICNVWGEGYNEFFGLADKFPYLAFDISSDPNAIFWRAGSCRNYLRPTEAHYLIVNNYYEWGGQPTREGNAYDFASYTLKDINFNTTGGTKIFKLKSIITGQPIDGQQAITRRALSTLTPSDYITIGIYKTYGLTGYGYPTEAFITDTQHYYFTQEINQLNIISPIEDKIYTTADLTYSFNFRNDGGNYTTLQLDWLNKTDNVSITFFKNLPLVNPGEWGEIIDTYWLYNSDYELSACMIGPGQNDICITPINFSVFAVPGGPGEIPQPPAEPGFEFNYQDVSPFDNPSNTYLYLASVYDAFLQPANGWANYYGKMFDFQELNNAGETIRGKIMEIRSYLKSFDNFFSGMPLTLFITIFIMVFLAKSSFMILSRLIGLFKT